MYILETTYNLIKKISQFVKLGLYNLNTLPAVSLLKVGAKGFAKGAFISLAYRELPSRRPLKGIRPPHQC